MYIYHVHNAYRVFHKKLWDSVQFIRFQTIVKSCFAYFSLIIVKKDRKSTFLANKKYGFEQTTFDETMQIDRHGTR